MHSRCSANIRWPHGGSCPTRGAQPRKADSHHSLTLSPCLCPPHSLGLGRSALRLCPVRCGSCGTRTFNNADCRTPSLGHLERAKCTSFHLTVTLRASRSSYVSNTRFREIERLGQSLRRHGGDIRPWPSRSSLGLFGPARLAMKMLQVCVAFL